MCAHIFFKMVMEVVVVECYISGNTLAAHNHTLFTWKDNMGMYQYSHYYDDHKLVKCRRKGVKWKKNVVHNYIGNTMMLNRIHSFVIKILSNTLFCTWTLFIAKSYLWGNFTLIIYLVILIFLTICCLYILMEFQVLHFINGH